MAKNVLRYLNSTKELCLCYTISNQQLQCYSDADWGGDSTDRKSYTGFVFMFVNSPVSWESEKQHSVALSSTEAEYMAMCATAKETVYLRKIFKELGLTKYISSATILNSDNLSAQELVKNPVYHPRSKHIDIRYHYIRDVYAKNEICLQYVPTNDMPADILTKNLTKTKHWKFMTMMGLLCNKLN